MSPHKKKTNTFESSCDSTYELVGMDFFFEGVGMDFTQYNYESAVGDGTIKWRVLVTAITDI